MTLSQARKQSLKIQRYCAVTRVFLVKVSDTRVLPDRAQWAPSCGVCGTQFSHGHARALCLNAHQSTWCHSCRDTSATNTQFSGRSRGASRSVGREQPPDVTSRRSRLRSGGVFTPSAVTRKPGAPRGLPLGVRLSECLLLQGDANKQNGQNLLLKNL